MSAPIHSLLGRGLIRKDEYRTGPIGLRASGRFIRANRGPGAKSTGDA